MKSNINRGPGRPAYEVKWPTSKFTMADLMEKNGVNPKTGKGKFCTKLTLVKALARDHAKRGHSFIVKLDETREPNSKSGLGRKTFVYIRRSKLDTLKTASKSTASVNVGTKSTKTRAPKVTSTTADYEATKADLLAPVPAVTITPDPTPAPEAEPATLEATAENSPAIADEPATAPDENKNAVTASEVVGIVA